MYFVKKNDDRKNVGFFDDFNSFFTGGLFSKELKTDIEETEKEYKVLIDVPGIDKNDIQVNFEDQVLTVSIHQNKELEDKNKSYIRKERNTLSMSRNYYLEYGDENKIKAKMDNGVLSIVIHKMENPITEKKTISIE